MPGDAPRARSHRRDDPRPRLRSAASHGGLRRAHAVAQARHRRILGCRIGVIRPESMSFTENCERIDPASSRKRCIASSSTSMTRCELSSTCRASLEHADPLRNLASRPRCGGAAIRASRRCWRHMRMRWRDQQRRLAAVPGRLVRVTPHVRRAGRCKTTRCRTSRNKSSSGIRFGHDSAPFAHGTRMRGSFSPHIPSAQRIRRRRSSKRCELTTLYRTAARGSRHARAFLGNGSMYASSTHMRVSSRSRKRIVCMGHGASGRVGMQFHEPSSSVLRVGFVTGFDVVYCRPATPRASP